MSVQNVRSFTMLECVAYTEAFNTTEVAKIFAGGLGQFFYHLTR